MIRSGRKEKEQETMDGSWLYLREYECPGCSRIWTHSEYRNMMTPGSLNRGGKCAAEIQFDEGECQIGR
jgi:hypothetical protein